MRLELTEDKIDHINQMLNEGQKLRKIAKSFRVCESTLRWKLAKAGYKVFFIGRLEPIRAHCLDRQMA